MGGGPRSPVLACCSIQCRSRRFVLGARSFVSGLDVVSSRRRRRRHPGLQRRGRRSGRSEGLRSLRRRSVPKFFCHLVRGTLLRQRLRTFCSEAMLAWRPAPSPLAHGRVSKKRRRDGAEESLRCASRAGALCCGSVSAHFARKLCWHGVLRPPPRLRIEKKRTRRR